MREVLGSLKEGVMCSGPDPYTIDAGRDPQFVASSVGFNFDILFCFKKL